MPRIHTVAADGTITAGDKLIGSDGAENANFVTRNYTVGGIKDFILDGTHAGSFTTVTTSGNATIGGAATITGALTTSSNATIGGNLTITGNTTIAGNLQVDGSTITFDDPILVLSGDTAPTSNNQKDTGIAFRWYESAGSGSAKIGFFGFDESTMKFTFVPDASISSEVVSGAAGTIVVKDVEAEEIYGYKFIDSQDNQYFVDPTAATSINVAGKILGGSMSIGNININTSVGEISGVTDIYAQKIYDSNDNNYFLDPTGGISLKVKGNIQLGDASAETNAEITSYGDLILKADVDADGAYERGVEIFRTKGANDGGVAVEFNKNQYDLDGNALPPSIWNQIAVGKVIHGLGTGPNNQNVTSATISQIVGWKDNSDNTLGTVLDEPPTSATKLQVYVNTAISYSSNSYLTVLASSATFDDNATRSIKFFSGSTEVASINKDGKLTISEIAAGSSAITTTGAFNAGSVTTSGNIVATGTIVSNNTDTINGININNSNQEMSGIGDVYANKYFDGQDDNYYLDPGHGGVSIKVAGKIEANNTDTINGININNTNQEMSGIGEIYAHKFIDSQTGSHYVDPGHSLSAVFAGRIRMVVPTYADDSAAGSGGLVAGDVYKTSGGDLKIKL